MNIPDIAEALKNPLDYSVSYAILGWSLSYIGGDVSALITEAQALQFIKAHKRLI